MGLLAVVGTFTAVVVVLIVVLLQAWFYNWRGSMAEAKILPMNSPETPLGRALVEQQEKINSYHWINREAQVRAIPIERAMELVAQEMAAAQQPPAKARRETRWTMTNTHSRSHALRGNGPAATLCVDAALPQRRGASEQWVPTRSVGTRSAALCVLLDDALVSACTAATDQRAAAAGLRGGHRGRKAQRPGAAGPGVQRRRRPDRCGWAISSSRIGPCCLMPVYFQCPMLCNLTLNGVVKAIRPLQLSPARITRSSRSASIPARGRNWPRRRRPTI